MIILCFYPVETKGMGVHTSPGCEHDNTCQPHWGAPSSSVPTAQGRGRFQIRHMSWHRG